MIRDKPKKAGAGEGVREAQPGKKRGGTVFRKMGNPMLKIHPGALGAVRELLGEIDALPARSPTKTVKIREVVDILGKFGALTFRANNGGVYRSRVGGHFIGRVSDTRNGHLKPFRGSYAIVVCVGSGINRTRKYMAAPL